MLMLIAVLGEGGEGEGEYAAVEVCGRNGSRRGSSGERERLGEYMR